jgi:5-methylcytosine-specific restriction endonuclease McrA
MLKRREEYEKFHRHKRKLFSESQKRVIACYQDYHCFGSGCRGQVLLPTTWELDHKVPLFEGGSNFYPFDDPGPGKGNLVIICSKCHAAKTQKERQDFFAKERDAKYGQVEDFELADEHYGAKPQQFLHSEETPARKVSPYFQHLDQFKWSDSSPKKRQRSEREVAEREVAASEKIQGAQEKHGNVPESREPVRARDRYPDPGRRSAHQP